MNSGFMFHTVLYHISSHRGKVFGVRLTLEHRTTVLFPRGHLISEHRLQLTKKGKWDGKHHATNLFDTSSTSRLSLEEPDETVGQTQRRYR